MSKIMIVAERGSRAEVLYARLLGKEYDRSLIDNLLPLAAEFQGGMNTRRVELIHRTL